MIVSFFLFNRKTTSDLGWAFIGLIDGGLEQHPNQHPPAPVLIQPRTACSWAPMRPATSATVVVRSLTAVELGKVEIIAVVGRDGVNADVFLFPLPEQ